MVPCSVLRHRGAHRFGLWQTALFTAVALVVAGCATNSNSGPPSHVLGAPNGTPLVVGQPAPPGTGDLGSVSCPTARRCWAVGVAGPNAAAAPGTATVIVATKDGGKKWHAQHVAGGITPELSGVSCPTPSDCMAVGSNGASLPGSDVVLTTTNAGTTWTQVGAPIGALTVTTVTCSSVTDCLVIVNDGSLIWSAGSADFGRTWQRFGDLPSLFGAGDDLSCTAGGPCLVAGYVPTGTGTGEGAVSLSTDGGQTWALANVPNGIGVLRTATCTVPTTCIAAGSTSNSINNVVPAHGAMVRSTDGGHTWQPATGTPPVDDVFDMECPSTTVCAMVGAVWKGTPAVGTGGVAQSGDTGTTFHLSSVAYVPLTLTALSCPTVRVCFATGGDTVARITVAPPKPPHHPATHTHTTGT